jgi:hypothetical protein
MACAPTVKIIISLVAAVAAAIVLAPGASAEPFCPPDSSTCCPTQARSCPEIDQQFLQRMTVVGIDQDPIHQSPGGLISGARNTVCPELDEGVRENNIVAELEKYSGFTQNQALAYIGYSTGYYCPNEYNNMR